MIKFFSMKFLVSWVLWLLLAGTTAWLWYQATNTRQEIGGARVSLNAGPQAASRSASLQVEFSRRQKDVERLQRYFLSQEEIGQFVGALEQEAAQAKIAVTIPAVQEKPALDEQGEPLPPGGVTRDVMFNITATGTPESLLEFLHRLESLPYVLYLQSWSVVNDTISARRRVISNLPLPSGSATPSPTPPGGKLEAQVVLTIINPPS